MWLRRAVVAWALLALGAGLGACASDSRVVWKDGRGAAGVAWSDAFVLIRDAADHEALYTLAGGLKPMSTGIWRGSFSVDEPDLTELRAARAMLAPLRNDIWYSDVQVFDNIHDGERSAHAFVIHRNALSRMIERFDDFWSPWGITAGTHPSEVVAVVDRMPREDRWRGYGYLFGYPADAVDFFVKAGVAARDGGEVGPGKDREFVHIRTHAEETGRFTYAVPLDHVVTAADEALADEAGRILDAYRDRRAWMRDLSSLVDALRRLNREFESPAAAAARVRDTHHTGKGVEHAVLDAR